jgi:hypothetical protein
VTKHEVTIEKARELLKESKGKLAAATVAVGNARAEDAAALVAAISSGGAPSARAIKRARAEEVEAADDVEAARAAHKQLEDDLADVEDELRQAEKAVDSAIAATLEPIAREMFAQALRRRAQWQAAVFTLDMLRPRLGPTSDLVKQIERLTYIDRFAAEDRELALKVRAAWAPSLAALRSDAEAQLPE